MTNNDIPNYLNYLFLTMISFFLGIKLSLVTIFGYHFYNLRNNVNIFKFLFAFSLYFYGLWATFYNIMIISLFYIIINLDLLFNCMKNIFKTLENINRNDSLSFNFNFINFSYYKNKISETIMITQNHKLFLLLQKIFYDVMSLKLLEICNQKIHYYLHKTPIFVYLDKLQQFIDKYKIPEDSKPISLSSQEKEELTNTLNLLSTLSQMSPNESPYMPDLQNLMDEGQMKQMMESLNLNDQLQKLPTQEEIQQLMSSFAEIQKITQDLSQHQKHVSKNKLKKLKRRYQNI
jgi:hypothetical protein